LTVTDDDDAAASTKATKTVLNRSPVASFTESAETVCVGEVIYFNASQSYDPDGYIVDYFWDFGDGMNATGAAVEHSYASDGTYTVTLTVTDDDGATDTSNSTKTVLRRDVAVLDVIPYKTVVGTGLNMSISVTVENQGDLTETFNVTIYVNTTLMAMQYVTDLAPSTQAILTFIWNTTGFTKGNYTIRAVASMVPSETDISDNTFMDGWTFVTILGDVDGDKDVDIYDVVKITGIYGSKRGDPQFNPNSDLDGDGEIKIYDVVICTSHYRQSW
ncbi:PKD domain-containing protein, partial [Candidatus Bathyarchaeota archaeon]|nr:PKD domain-containing protein [Candidatus Bathyarchaeota archaeon]